ncbi:phosphonate ABC transporter, permease protein PhnE [Hyphomonas atlantica corrig.]|uniref:phosphonate ABC transporter, permease protein PhnE n=1 Tax=Hyphomonas atlantica TaxID=1280948 RepID=UPI0023553975|nr:phosphonate ABC transporter, permease protein PhnE [Hyphomonas atlantica]
MAAASLGLLIAEAEALSPGLVRRTFADRIKSVAPFFLGLTAFIWICIDIDLSPATFLSGFSKLGDFLGNMFPPSSGGQLPRILNAILETFGMAFAGTFLGVVIAIPLGIIGAKNIISFGPLHFLIRRVFDFFRGIPALVWALVLVSAFGLGPFAGVVALALADIPVLSKLYAEAIENVDRKPIEGLRAAGCGRFDVIRYGIMPQVTPIILSQALYYLESNFRNAAILGVVGAGGIGFELEERIRIFAFDEVSFIILLFMVAVACLDTVSGNLRRRLA